MKRFLSILFMAILAIAITLASNATKIFSNASQETAVVSLVNDAIIDQNITSVNEQEKMIYKLYDAGVLVGVLEDLTPIRDVLESAYSIEFSEIFPNKDIYLGEDLYIAQELSYYDFEDISSQIADYIRNRDVYTVQAYSVEFSNENGIYANIFVDNLDIYQALCQ